MLSSWGPCRDMSRSVTRNSGRAFCGMAQGMVPRILISPAHGRQQPYRPQWLPRYAMQTRPKGRGWAFGDDISTDHIIAGKYLGTTDAKVFAEHAFEAVDPTWAKKVQPGDILVAGDKLGGGASGEQAPVALKPLGISAILANSFARIFFRNAINLGFPVLECPGLLNKTKAEDVIEVDL